NRNGRSIKAGSSFQDAHNIVNRLASGGLAGEFVVTLCEPRAKDLTANRERLAALTIITEQHSGVGHGIRGMEGFGRLREFEKHRRLRSLLLWLDFVAVALLV